METYENLKDAIKDKCFTNMCILDSDLDILTKDTWSWIKSDGVGYIRVYARNTKYEFKVVEKKLNMFIVLIFEEGVLQGHCVFRIKNWEE